MQVATRTIAMPMGKVEIDAGTGAIAAIHLNEPDTDFVTPPDERRPAAGCRAAPALPVALPAVRHARPPRDHRGRRRADAQVRLARHPMRDRSRSTSRSGSHPSDEGLVLSASVHNGWSAPLPQIIFPQLMDLEATGGVDDTRLQLGRYRMKPFQELAMQPDDARWLDRPLHKYIPYADFRFNMKWLDYGDEHHGLTLFSRNTRHTAQGLVIQRVDRAVDRVNLRWSHHPMVQPGETWESGEYVLLPHAGDWYAGARAYQAFASDAYPYNAPQRIREAMAIRSMWAAPRNAPPNLSFSQLPAYAEDVADPELGIAEIVLWHWWYRNGYPDPGRPTHGHGRGSRRGAQTLPGARRADRAVRQSPHPPRHRRDRSRLGPPQRRQPGRHQQLDLRP